MFIDPDKYAHIHLGSGSHSHHTVGMCLMEAIAFLMGEQHSDRPKCVSPVLSAMGMALNDTFDERRRQDLKELIPVLIGTSNDGLDAQRGYMALDWMTREWLPLWMPNNVAGLLRRLDPIVNSGSMEYAGEVVSSLRTGLWSIADCVVDPNGPHARVVQNSGFYGPQSGVMDTIFKDGGQSCDHRAQRFTEVVHHAGVHGAQIKSRDELESIVTESQLSVIELYANMAKVPSLTSS